MSKLIDKITKDEDKFGTMAMYATAGLAVIFGGGAAFALIMHILSK